MNTWRWLLSLRKWLLSLWPIRRLVVQQNTLPTLEELRQMQARDVQHLQGTKESIRQAIEILRAEGRNTEIYLEMQKRRNL